MVSACGMTELSTGYCLPLLQKHVGVPRGTRADSFVAVIESRDHAARARTSLLCPLYLFLTGVKSGREAVWGGV